MWYCDYLNKLIVSFTTVPGSHECPDYHAVHYRAKTAHLLRKKWNVAILIRWGRLCHSIWDRFCHIGALFMIPCRITYKQSLQMVKEPIGDQGSPRSLPQRKPHKICTGASITEKIGPGTTCGCHFVHSWWWRWMKHSFYPPRALWVTSSELRSVPPLMCLHRWQNLPHIRGRFCQMRYPHIIDASVEITEIQLKPSLEALAMCNQPVKYQSPTAKGVSARANFGKSDRTCPDLPYTSWSSIGDE